MAISGSAGNLEPETLDVLIGRPLSDNETDLITRMNRGNLSDWEKTEQATQMSELEADITACWEELECLLTQLGHMQEYLMWVQLLNKEPIQKWAARGKYGSDWSEDPCGADAPLSDEDVNKLGSALQGRLHVWFYANLMFDGQLAKDVYVGIPWVLPTVLEVVRDQSMVIDESTEGDIDNSGCVDAFRVQRGRQDEVRNRPKERRLIMPLEKWQNTQLMIKLPRSSERAVHPDTKYPRITAENALHSDAKTVEFKDLLGVVSKGLYRANSKLVGDISDPVVFYDWKDYISTLFHPIKNGTEFHQFHVSADHPGVVKCREFSDSPDGLRKENVNVSCDDLPKEMFAKGLDLDPKNLTCPNPATCKRQKQTVPPKNRRCIKMHI
ncbi:hypothetical protein DPMN_014344 [Dreissena polymorpha]|uniref:Uncharacterized protein n=1 Tax=Dreissena polymorpha TaxID=45954 RepID=A0A9D4NAR4_DREPO|nr:hypothetical protein DPMN_014344 [Dreissena polymorpha]